MAEAKKQKPVQRVSQEWIDQYKDVKFQNGMTPERWAQLMHGDKVEDAYVPEWETGGLFKEIQKANEEARAIRVQGARDAWDAMVENTSNAGQLGILKQLKGLWFQLHGDGKYFPNITVGAAAAGTMCDFPKYMEFWVDQANQITGESGTPFVGGVENPEGVYDGPSGEGEMTQNLGDGGEEYDGYDSEGTYQGDFGSGGGSEGGGGYD